MKTTKTRGWVAAMAGVIMMAGCGSSSEPAAGTQTPAVGTTPTAGAAASAAGAGAAGAGALSVTCGATTCTNPAGSALSLIKMFMPTAMLAEPCCLPAGGCGWKQAGACIAPPEKAMCPTPSLPVPGLTVTGCCIASSQTCGIDSSALGLGCMAAMFGGGPTTKCDGTPVAAAPTTGAAGSAAGATATATAGTGVSAAGASASAAGRPATAGTGTTTSGAAGVTGGAAGARAGAGGSR